MPRRRPHLRLAAAAAAALHAALLLLSRPASACGADPTGPHLTSPVSGQTTSVPLNVRVGLMLWPGGRGGGAFEDAQLVEKASGAVVLTQLEPRKEGPAGVRRAWLVPAMPLRPGQEYTVRSGSSVLDFRTGAAADTTPPPAPEGTQVRGEERTKEPNDCDASRGRYGALVFTPPAPGEPVTYTVREEGRVLAADVPAERLQALVPCGLNLGAPESLRLAPGTHTLQLVAVDLAGNASAPVALSMSAACPGAGSGGQGMPGGCAAAGPGGLVAVGSALLALLFRRRARSHGS